ncbi:MAG: MBL fold metallo-hydrolase [Candidatus Riflebacteria bacterium]
MKIIPLKPPPNTYSCIPYFILGDWNAIEDVNTLIDPGPDDRVILDQVGRINTGLGKNAVDQIIFTHGHYDHAGCAQSLKDQLNCRLLGNFQAEFIDQKLYNGQKIRIGDEECEIMHAPFHSHDSICIYCRRHRLIFTGDTTIRVQRYETSYSESYCQFIKWLEKSGIKAVYGGHDPPIIEDLPNVLSHSISILNQVHF